MENQHRKITGYRELSQEEIDLMNKVKALGVQIQELSGEIGAHIAKQWDESKEGDAETERLQAAEPSKWLNWGTDSMQSALMYMTRAVAQPTNF